MVIEAARQDFRWRSGGCDKLIELARRPFGRRSGLRRMQDCAGIEPDPLSDLAALGLQAKAGTRSEVCRAEREIPVGLFVRQRRCPAEHRHGRECFDRRFSGGDHLGRHAAPERARTRPACGQPTRLGLDKNRDQQQVVAGENPAGLATMVA